MILKLLFISQNEAPFRMKWMDELAKYMDVKIYHLNEYEENISNEYISYHTYRAQTEDISTSIFKKKLYDYKKILKEDYDVLLLDGYGFFAQQLLIIFLKIIKKKYGLSIDGGFIPKKENILKKKIKTFFIKGATFYLSTSQDTDSYLNYYGVNKNIIYRHYFSNVSDNDIENSPLSLEEKLKIRTDLGIENVFTLISVGQLIYRKGFDCLVEAIKGIHGEFQLFIIGSGNNSHLKDMMIKNKHIHHIEFISRDQLDQYYKASDVFILPTREDVWGLVVGEAMAKGLPIIATNKCLAAKAMIENGMNGYIVCPENIDEMMNAIIKVMNVDLNNMGAKSIETIKKYSLEYSAKCDYMLFKELKNNELL